MNLFVLLVIIVWCSLAIFGDVLLKRDSFFGYGALVYAATAVPSYYVFHRHQFGWVTVVWAAISVPVGLSAAFFIYHEPLTPRRCVGAVLAILAVALSE